MYAARTSDKRGRPRHIVFHETREGAAFAVLALDIKAKDCSTCRAFLRGRDWCESHSDIQWTSRADSYAQAFPSFSEASSEQSRLEGARRAASVALNAIPGLGTGAIGLTPDDVRARADYRAAKAAFDLAHQTLQAFNAWFVWHWRDDIKTARRERDDARAASAP